MIAIGLFKIFPLLVCCLETKKYTHIVIVFSCYGDANVLVLGFQELEVIC
jgi:hypothetical protein